MPLASDLVTAPSAVPSAALSRLRHQVLVRAAPMPRSCFGRYVRVGVALVDPALLPDGRREPRMLSSRARGVVEVVRTWERCHSGKGVRDAARGAIGSALELAALLDAGLEPDLGADACDLDRGAASC